jgi:hypothetical protein
VPNTKENNGKTNCLGTNNFYCRVAERKTTRRGGSFSFEPPPFILRRIMKFEIFKIADISTKYITESDGEKMGQLDLCIANIKGGYGDILSVSGTLVDDAIRAGMSAAFVNIIKELLERKIPYVRFDADGGEIEGEGSDRFPKFEW